MGKPQKATALFDNVALLSMLGQEHNRFELRIRNGKEAIESCTSQKKKDRFLRMTREFTVCQHYLERVYLFSMTIPSLLLQSDGRYNVLSGILKYVLTLDEANQGFESGEEFELFNKIKDDGGLTTFSVSYEQLNEDTGLQDFFSKVNTAIQACVCDILACREAVFKR